MAEAVGTVQAEQLAAVTSRVVGTIDELRVSAGQRVAGGAILAVLDDRDLRHRVEQAQEAVLGAEATLAQARADYARDKPLADQRVITPYDFEHTQTNLKTAEANWRRLQQAAREADVTLSYAVIRSPFAGVVVDRLANVGDLAALRQAALHAVRTRTVVARGQCSRGHAGERARRRGPDREDRRARPRIERPGRGGRALLRSRHADDGRTCPSGRHAGSRAGYVRPAARSRRRPSAC